MITKDFEKYFPLPWKMHRFGEGDNIITASGEPLCYIKCGKTEQNRNACQYLVRCANLMPEAVAVIKDLVMIMEQPDYAPESLDYSDYVVQRAKELLAKLEGGETA